MNLFGSERSPAVLCALLQHTLLPLNTPMAEKLVALSKSSIPVVSEVYNITVEFGKNVISFLHGCNSTDIFNILSILFSGFSTYMDVYGTGEGEFLSKIFLKSLKLITFESQANSLGLGEENENENNYNNNQNNYQNNNGQDEFNEQNTNTNNNNNNSNNNNLNSELNQDVDLDFDFSGPIERFEAYGDRLILAADSVMYPTQSGLLRGINFMGGLKVKSVSRALAMALSVYIKQLSFKVDCLRIACGFQTESEFPSINTLKSLKGVKGVKEGMKEGVKNTESDRVSGSVSEEESQAVDRSIAEAESWAKRLDGQDVRGMALLPSALRALQVSTYVLTFVGLTEFFALFLFLEMSSHLLLYLVLFDLQRLLLLPYSPPLFSQYYPPLNFLPFNYVILYIILRLLVDYHAGSWI